MNQVVKQATNQGINFGAKSLQFKRVHNNNNKR